MISIPELRSIRAHWREGLPPGTLDVTCRVGLETEVELSVAPGKLASQIRLLPLRIRGSNPGDVIVFWGAARAVVGKDGTFALQKAGGGASGAWRELLIGRLEGPRLAISVFECDLMRDRSGERPPVVCKIRFRGACWARLSRHTRADERPTCLGGPAAHGRVLRLRHA